ncbi:MAG: tetratricopeptide repeat protein [Candidatus Caldatribacterium sp.]|uniref:tetratricopeptide repeat protein n=1 Tax=Candidatus Caldatribacterium sp. TaxID=2282143 RepID=UPI0029966691|nr:tetratricopeptide repeat protein [Candidatus Caldatribacterium sp.]MCX7731327.1 tetratricopeptide repeat protein [Candidatus Caldatribacterium sp.]MDW8080886.1 tetratricopeptide repeat protein [Candidatus Calescibacterium sp.]
MRKIILLGVFLLLWGNALSLAQDKEEYYRVGYVYFSQGNYEKALEAYRKALEIDPQYLDARYWLGKTLEQMGRISEAVKEWRTILSIAPRHRDAFQKWRAYAPSFVRDGEVIEQYKEVFLREDVPSFSREEGWSSLAPLGFVLLEQNDFLSSYLASRIFGWAREHLSLLFAPYEEEALRKALEGVISGEPRLVYRFLREFTVRFGEDPVWREPLQKAFEQIFSSTLGGAQGAQGVEFTLLGGKVEKRILYGSTLEETSFFLNE